MTFNCRVKATRRLAAGAEATQHTFTKQANGRLV